MREKTQSLNVWNKIIVIRMVQKRKRVNVTRDELDLLESSDCDSDSDSEFEM